MENDDKKQNIPIKARPPIFLLGNDSTMDLPTTKSINSKKHWARIRKLLDNVRKNKHILGIIIEYLSTFKNHIHRQITTNTNDIPAGTNSINKFEYFNLVELIDSLANQICNLRTILNKRNIYFFDVIWCHTNITNLTEIYVHTLYLIEKYGGANLLYIINTYLLIYTALHDIYVIWDNEYNRYLAPGQSRNSSPIGSNISNTGNKSNSAKPNMIGKSLGSSGVSRLFNAAISSSSDESDISEDDNVSYSGLATDGAPATHTYNSGGTTNLFHSPHFLSMFSTINKYYCQHIFNPRKSRINIGTTLGNSTWIFHKLITSQSTGYLNMLNTISAPIQMTVLFINNNQQTDLYNSLSVFHSLGIIKNKSLLNTNQMVSEIYKETAIRALAEQTTTNLLNFDRQQSGNQDVWITDITNPLIFATIPNFDKIRDRVVHIFLRIKTGAGCLLIIITGILINENTIVLNNYNLLERRVKHITQDINDLDDIAVGFRNNLMRLLTLKQLLTATGQQITAWCYDKWNLYNTIIKMSMMEMMNYFLAQSLHRKTEILTVLLIHTSNADSVFRAYILWDLVIDENTPLVEKEIFANLHTSIQLKLRNTIDSYMRDTSAIDGSVSDSEATLGNTHIKTEELSYEKRIQLLKTDDAVRAKALEKLREINNKSNDNSSKPQQYLDGLLSIPFGTFAKEWIITNSENILEKTSTIFINFICLCYDYRDIYVWARPALEWSATNFGLPGLVEFTGRLSSRQSSPSSRSVFAGSDRQSAETISSGKLAVEPALELENYLIRELDISRCGIINIRKLSTYLEQQIIAKRVLVSPANLETPVLTEALNSLDILQLQDLQFELKQEGILVNINPASHGQLGKLDIKSPCVLENTKACRVIIEYLISEGYFNEIGFPTDLVRFQHRLNELITVHNGHRADKQRFIQNTRARLDSSIYGQREAKDQIVRIIAQWVNGNQDGYCLGFEGSPGLGKTSLAKYGISQALVDANGKARPFGFIALGGSANGSILEGHSYTYVGSTWGRIVDILIQSKCMNPIIFIDELDKISHTESGRELIGILTHLTDRTQNNEFMDKYFAGVKLDLSKVLFIFSYNDYSLLDPILADRIHRVHFENYTISDKVAISRDYLVPRIAAEINMSLPISLDPTTIEYIINSYTYEAGVRKLKEKYYDIYRELNVRDISGELDSYELSPTDNSLTLTTNLIDSILATHHKIEIDRPLVNPRVGVVYGLYATGMGIGGLTIIQVSRKLADHGGILLCTGKQGDVMMESMKVALTLACSLVPDSVLEKWGLLPDKQSTSRLVDTNSNSAITETNKNKDSGPRCPTLEHNGSAKSNPATKWSFHIHVPDGATSKDGPSAGCAITLGLVSLLLDRPVRNDISMTGEIDMLGHVLPIGGLDAKITGSKLAGIRTILVPRRNNQDLQRIQTRTPEICAGLTIHLVDTIHEVLEHGLVKY
jgi:ATP-dependent Lon protease